MKSSKNLIRACIFSLVIPCVLLGLQLCKPADFNKKKIVYVNSYHSEFPPSKQITEGVYENLPADSFEIVTFFMNTKRNPQKAFILEQSAKMLDSIKMEDPDLLIASDDNAMKYLVEPNFKDDPMPIVFCGVNWSVAQYDLSRINVTGIIEILPVAESIRTIKSYYPSMQNLLVINENTTTSRKTKPLLDTLLADWGISVTQKLVENFDDWKSAFIVGNETFDAIYLQTRGAIDNWDHEEAMGVIYQNIKVPLFTCEDFMMPYAVLGLTQISKEQGIRAAEMAKRVLSGTDPAEIPISKNTMTNIWINSILAEKIDFVPDAELLKKATIIN